MKKQQLEHELEQVLQAKIVQLPQEISPERDLWSGIERAIADKEQSIAAVKTSSIITMLSQRQSLAWAASVIVAILLTWTTFAPLQDNDNSALLVAQMQQNFQQQKQTMLTSFGQPKLGNLSVKMREQFSQLATAQAAIKKALANDPNNTDLLNLLHWTQQQELDLVKQLYGHKWQSI